MKKNMGIVFITIGILFIVSGIILLTKQADNNEKPVELVALSEQSNPISPTAQAQPADQSNEAQEQTNSNIEESASKGNSLTDNEVKGQRFEEYVVTHFSKKNFILKEWRSDKYVKGRYAKSNQYPDLELSLHLKNGTSFDFAVECKWRSGFVNGKTTWCEPDQFQRYKQFISERGIPTFVVIGIGGEPSNPEAVYVFNIATLKGNVIYNTNLEHFYHDPSKNFFFDAQKQMIR